MLPTILFCVAAASLAVFAFNNDDQEDEAQDIDVIEGDDTANDITGTAGDDFIRAYRGDDIIKAGDGDDIAFGGTDHDTIDGGDGNDLLFGRGGFDTLHGGAGDDWVDGGNSDDTLIGGAGDDLLIGGLGEDLLQGGDGDDILTGDDLLERPLNEQELVALRTAQQSGDGGSTLNGVALGTFPDTDSDFLEGGDGDDVLFLGRGDFGEGGNGSDAFWILDGPQGLGWTEVEDFTAGEDVMLVVHAAGTPTPTLDLLRDGPNSQILRVDGVDTARVIGKVTLADIVPFERGSIPGFPV